MNSLSPFLHHKMDNLPNETQGRAQATLADGWQSHCLPGSRKNAAFFLKGQSPGLQRTLTPQDADAPPCQQDAETVLKLVEWREEAPYG